VPGACAAFLGTYAAPILLIALTATLFQRFRRVAWVRRVELALRPLVIAFMGAAALAIARDPVLIQH
jgi:chromate transport protein ChrA